MLMRAACGPQGIFPAGWEACHSAKLCHSCAQSFGQKHSSHLGSQPSWLTSYAAGLGLMCIKLSALLDPCCLRPFRGMACWLDAFQGARPCPSWAGEHGGDRTCPLPDSGGSPASAARSTADACASLAIHSWCSLSDGPALSGSLSLCSLPAGAVRSGPSFRICFSLHSAPVCPGM